MKKIIAIFGLLSMFSSGFAAQANTYSCEGYTLTISNSETKSTIRNDAAESSSELKVAGPSSSHTQSVWFNASLVPVSMNVLAHLNVRIDIGLLEGADSGEITTLIAADISSAAKHSCKKN